MSGNFEPTEEQLAAIEMYKENRFSLILGTPGSGKTTMISLLHALFPNDTLIVTTTGAAANRILNCTGLDAYVFKFVSFGNNTSSTEERTLIEKYYGKQVIVDEASMMNPEDLLLLISILKPMRLLLIADPNQLPCISGPTSPPFIRGLAQSDYIPKTVLRSNHRQRATASALFLTIQNLVHDSFTQPLYFDETFKIHYTNTDEAAIKSAAEFFMTITGLDEKCQMLATKNTIVNELNHLTRQSGASRIVCNLNYYKDKVLLVANGSVGTRFTDARIEYDNGFVDEKKFVTNFQPANCMTVHKSQGNEFDSLVIIVLTRDYYQREKLYTALSRAKTSAVLFGTRDVVRSYFSTRFSQDNVKEVVEYFKKTPVNT